MTKHMLTFGFATVVAMGSFALFGSVYDDAFWWFNQPREKDGTGTAGVVETGELADALRYGDSTNNAHMAVRYGYPESGSNVVQTVKTAYFNRELPVALLSDVKKDGKVYPATFKMQTAINATRGTPGDEFSIVLRFKWDGNSHSTAWLFACSTPTIGINGGRFRVYPNPPDGTSTGFSALPVVADRWYDVGLSLVKASDGKSSALKIILVDDEGVVKTVEVDEYATSEGASIFPGTGNNFIFGSESNKSEGTASTVFKYFTGAIQQVACWNRALSYDEF